MKPFLLIFILFHYVIYSSGQISIKGIVTDLHQSLPSATVLLLSADSALVKGVVTDLNGEFIFNGLTKGHYLISSSMVGYVNYISAPVLIETDLHLPAIILQEVSTKLNDVVVTAEKPFFEQKIDRLIINVQSSITSSGNTILEVLQKSPGIVVNKQNNSISMNGKSGVRVMIDGKIMQLPLDVVVQMLDGMNSANVEKIELITTPPAKYDAEGNAGIIHIVTKGNIEIGTNGSVGFTAGAHWAETLGANLNFSHRNKKFAYTFDYSMLRNHNQHILNLNRQSIDHDFIQSVHDYSPRENVTTQQNLSAGVEWKVTDHTLLSVSFTAYRRNWDLNAVNNETNRVSSDSTIRTTMQIHEANIWQSATGAIGLQTKPNSKSELGFNVDYLYYHNDNPSQYNNISVYEQSNTAEQSKIDLKKSTPIRFVIARTDYQYTISPSIILETGLKGVLSHLDNNVIAQRLINNQWTIDPVFTSYSTLNEQVGAVYISTRWLPGNKWQVNSGLRYEYTHTSISTPTEKNLINRKYGYFFPSLSFNKDLGNEKDFQFSYSRRITRPTYNDIAPFVFFWGPNTFSSGNTSLRPAVSDAIKAGYHVKQWIISLQLTRSIKEIASWQPETDDKLSLIYRSQNMKYLNTVGLTNSYSFSILPWWETQSNFTAQYQVARTSHLPINTKLHLYGLNLNITNILKLPNDFAIEVSGTYQSTSLAGIALYLPMGSLNAGVQKKLGEKGTLRLSMDDILNTNYWRIKTNLPDNNLNSYFYYNFHNQYVRITYTLNLGNNKLRSVRLKSGSEEERGRVK